MKMYFAVLTFLLVSLNVSILVAQQSDYEIQKAYESAHKSLLQRIDNAESVTELLSLREEIAGLKNKYQPHSTLLDNALYPDNFSSSIAKLETQWSVAQTRLAQVEELEDENEDLQNRVITLTTRLEQLEDTVKILRKENAKLLGELSKLRTTRTGRTGNTGEIRELESKLTDNIRRRDELIAEMLTKIFSGYSSDFTSLSESQRNVIRSDVEEGSVLANLLYLAQDNLQFVKNGLFDSFGFKELVDNYEQFNQDWETLKPKIAVIYAENEEGSKMISAIDSTISDWKFALKESMWSSIYQLFLAYDVKVFQFFDGQEFIQSMKQYIDSNMSNVDELNEETYAVFVDTLWNGRLDSSWIPMLIERDVVTVEQITEVKQKMNDWHDKIYGGSNSMLYIIIGIILIAAIVSGIFLFGKKNKKESGKDDLNDYADTTEENEYEADENEEEKK